LSNQPYRRAYNVGRPVPEFNSKDETHKILARLGREAQGLTAQIPIEGRLHFSATRRRFREALEQTQAMQQINDIVYELLS
jgi:hypothetical protein